MNDSRSGVATISRGSFTVGVAADDQGRKPKYSLIVPAHNEAERISPNIIEYLESFTDSEVIVVLNGCTDGTEAIVVEIAKRYENLVAIHIDHAVGKGGAVRAGFLAARAPIVGYVDADGSTSADEIRRLFDILDDDLDGVIASRWLRGSHVLMAQPWLRRLSSRAFNTIVRILFGMRFSDTQCGAKVFRASAIREIAPALEISNFAFDIDLLYQLQLAGKRVIEVPTRWCDKSGSRVELPKASKEMSLAAMRLRMRHSVFRYIIPLFDRIWPTRPLRERNALSVLFLNWRDPKHPQAGGAEKYLLEVGKRLVKRGHNVHWLTASFPHASPTDSIDGIDITRVGGRFSVYWMLPLAYVRTFRDRFDIVIDAENGIPFFSPLFSFKPKICLMHHVHQTVFRDHLPFPISELFRWLEAKAMPAIYRNLNYIAVSNDTRDEMVELGIDANHIDVVFNGVDAPTAVTAKAKRPTILYVGRLKKYKRIHLIIDAIASLRKSIPDIELIVAGSGEEADHLQRRVESLDLVGNVRFDGYVSEERKYELMASAWVFAMPSEMEGWGLTIIEANSCGTPAVGYAVRGVREAIVGDESGILVDAQDEFVEALRRVLVEPDTRERLSRGARSRAAQFSWDGTCKNVLRVIDRAISKQHMSIVSDEGIWTVIP